MSGKDHDQLSDAQFTAFLQGDDALARELAALDQPAPPPALDAAIHARVAAALAAERLAALPAANDPVLEGAAGGTGASSAHTAPRWQSRWQLPLALAAGIAAISIALPLWQTHDPFSEATVAPAPGAPTTPTLPTPAMPQTPAARPAAQAAAQPGLEGMPTAPTLHEPAPAPAQANKSVPASNRTNQSHSTVHAEPAAAAKRATLMDSTAAEDTGRAPTLAAAPEPAPVTERPPMLLPAPAPAPFVPPAPAPAPAPTPAPPPPPAPAPATARMLMPAPPAPPAPAAPAATVVQPDDLTGTVVASASNVRAAPTTELHRQAPRSVSVTGSRIMAPGETQAQLTAPAWLQKIDELLQKKERGAALVEWQKFRAAYPAYPVPDKLAANFPPVAE